MPKAESGTVLVLATPAGGTAMAALRRSDSFDPTGYVLRRLRPKPLSHSSAIAATVLVDQALQRPRDPKRERGLGVEEEIAESTNSLTALLGKSAAGIGTSDNKSLPEKCCRLNMRGEFACQHWLT
jgi:hypothetical protein